MKNAKLVNQTITRPKGTELISLHSSFLPSRAAFFPLEIRRFINSVAQEVVHKVHDFGSFSRKKCGNAKLENHITFSFTIDDRGDDVPYGGVQFTPLLAVETPVVDADSDSDRCEFKHQKLDVEIVEIVEIADSLHARRLRSSIA